MSAHGVVAQLVEHLHGMQGVVSSSLISTTNFTYRLCRLGKLSVSPQR